MKTKLKIIMNVPVIMLLVFTLSSCGNMDYNKGDESDADKQKSETQEKIKEEAMELKTEIKDMIATFDNKIDNYQKKIKDQGETISEESQKTIDNLEARKEELKKKLQKIDETSSENWEKFKDDVKEKTKEFQQDIDNFFNPDEN
ncbi:MAG: YtxH domain-containing protein [Bacteroidales bacterium]|nr:YtxH domain-containing protein [Bacteroidales bacterium]